MRLTIKALKRLIKEASESYTKADARADDRREWQTLKRKEAEKLGEEYIPDFKEALQELEKNLASTSPRQLRPPEYVEKPAWIAYLRYVRGYYLHKALKSAENDDHIEIMKEIAEVQPVTFDEIAKIKEKYGTVLPDPETWANNYQVDDLQKVKSEEDVEQDKTADKEAYKQWLYSKSDYDLTHEQRRHKKRFNTIDMYEDMIDEYKTAYELPDWFEDLPEWVQDKLYAEWIIHGHTRKAPEPRKDKMTFDELRAERQRAAANDVYTPESRADKAYRSKGIHYWLGLERGEEPRPEDEAAWAAEVEKRNEEAREARRKGYEEYNKETEEKYERSGGNHDFRKETRQKLAKERESNPEWIKWAAKNLAKNKRETAKQLNNDDIGDVLDKASKAGAATEKQLAADRKKAEAAEKKAEKEELEATKTAKTKKKAKNEN